MIKSFEVQLKRMAVCVIGTGAVCVAYAKTSQDYVKNGLVAMWDGHENAGVFNHRADATTWVDLVNGLEIPIPDWVTIEDHSLYSATVPGTTKSNIPSLSSIKGLSSSDTAWTIEVVQQGFDWTFTDSPGNLQYVFSTPRGSLGYRRFEANGFYFYGPCDATQISVQNWAHKTAKVKDRHTMSAKLGANKSTCSIWMDGVKDTVDYNGSYTAARPSVFKFFANSRMDMRVFAIRVYNRALTQEEITANRAVDVARFDNGD